MNPSLIRNFAIIAHIDHGKSTLADRILERTGTVGEREMTDQLLDAMDLEREKGVTIKASAVRMAYEARDGSTYQLNLIDTPGHVDFSYEVSRALASCEGAVLVVDASQGIQAQTLANLRLAQEQGLEVLPVVNKIDLPAADPEGAAGELASLLGVPLEQVVLASAKEGIGIDEVLEGVVQRLPPPRGEPDSPLRALVFDSHYDPYQGVVTYLRVVDGHLSKSDRLKLMASGLTVEPMEIGVFRPGMVAADRLEAGEVGYVATGAKEVRALPVGDTVTFARGGAADPLPGYRSVQPMVFAGIHPTDAGAFAQLRDGLDKLRLNDAALIYEPEESQALGPGFRCGFLGLFHMEIVQERLEREFDLNLLATAPSVRHRVVTKTGEVVEVESPARLPDPGQIAQIEEPWMQVSVYAPEGYIGPIMELVTGRRGEFDSLEYLDEKRVQLLYRMPLSEMIVEFYDQLKSRTRGYASFDYVLEGYRPADLVKLSILVNKDPVDALSVIVHRDQAAGRGTALVRRLKEVIPRQLFPVPIQAAVGNKVIARETVKALRKDVLAKCYGGDVTRKRKLLEKQKTGKRRMKRIGKVELPQEAFTAILRLGDG